MTAADKPRRDLGADCSCARCGGYDSLCVIHGPNGTQAQAQNRRAADKPRADLVALFDAFARLPEGHASLSLRGDHAGEVLEGWAAVCGHRVEFKPMSTPLNGHWTMLEVRMTGGTISVHLETVRSAQADPQVLARVQAALDGSSEVGMPLGMTSDEVIQYWPGALEAMPPGVDRLSVDSTDGDLWLVHRDGTERVWLAEDRTWSPAADRHEQPETAGSV